MNNLKCGRYLRYLTKITMNCSPRKCEINHRLTKRNVIHTVFWGRTGQIKVIKTKLAQKHLESYQSVYLMSCIRLQLFYKSLLMSHPMQTKRFTTRKIIGIGFVLYMKRTLFLDMIRRITKRKNEQNYNTSIQKNIRSMIFWFLFANHIELIEQRIRTYFVLEDSS